MNTARIIKRAEVVALQRKRDDRRKPKPSCPNIEVKQWIKQHTANRPTVASARQAFNDLFRAK